MMLALSVVSGLLPSFILLGYFYAHDVNREPGKAVLMTYALGIIILVPVAVLELTVFGEFHAFNHPFLAGLTKAFWGAAIPEELLKFLVVVGYCARLRTFDERMDGMVYGAVASLGFAHGECAVRRPCQPFPGRHPRLHGRALSRLPGGDHGLLRGPG